MAFKTRVGTTFIELIFTLLIFSVIFIPVSTGIRMVTQYTEGLSESMFITGIRTRINQASSESLYKLDETRIVYNKGSTLNGFVFKGDFFLEFTHYGQIKKGASVKLVKDNETYVLSVRPVTGIASLKKE